MSAREMQTHRSRCSLTMYSPLLMQGSGSECGGHRIKASAVERMGACAVQVYHEMVVLERIHQNPCFSPGVTLEALTRQPLRFH